MEVLRRSCKGIWWVHEHTPMHQGLAQCWPIILNTADTYKEGWSGFCPLFAPTFCLFNGISHPGTLSFSVSNRLQIYNCHPPLYFCSDFLNFYVQLESFEPGLPAPAWLSDCFMVGLLEQQWIKTQSWWGRTTYLVFPILNENEYDKFCFYVLFYSDFWNWCIIWHDWSNNTEWAKSKCKRWEL